MFLDNPFNLELYAKISRFLKEINEEVKYFWDEVLMNYRGVVIREQLFSADRDRSKIVKKVNKYFNSDEEYHELRKRLDNVQINFEHGDIFTSSITGSFDNILLSNIAAYNKLDKMLMLFNMMVPLLNDDGKMLLAYLYETDLYSSDYMEEEPEIYDIPKVLKTFPKDITFNSFIGVRGLSFKSSRLRDSIITYKKVKKI